MNRTQQEIIGLANTIKSSAQNLPAVSVFGDDNEEEIEYLLDVSRQLYAAAGGRQDEVDNEEVQRWLAGELSELEDFL